MPMNAYFCQDLTDYFNSSIDIGEPFHWLREELRVAARNKFDCLIVVGFLTLRAKQYIESDKVAVQHDVEENSTEFSGWAQTKEKAKRITSPFTQDFVEKDDNLFKEQMEKQRRQEEEDEKLFKEQMEKQRQQKQNE